MYRGETIMRKTESKRKICKMGLSVLVSALMVSAISGPMPAKALQAASSAENSKYGIVYKEKMYQETLIGKHARTLTEIVMKLLKQNFQKLQDLFQKHGKQLMNDKKILEDKIKKLQALSGLPMNQTKAKQEEIQKAGQALMEFQKKLEEMSIIMQGMVEAKQKEFSEVSNNIQIHLQGIVNKIVQAIAKERGVRVVFGMTEGEREVLWVDSDFAQDLTQAVVDKFNKEFPELPEHLVKALNAISTIPSIPGLSVDASTQTPAQ